jgi:hypothetical protein
MARTLTIEGLATSLGIPLGLVRAAVRQGMPVSTDRAGVQKVDAAEAYVWLQQRGTFQRLVDGRPIFTRPMPLLIERWAVKRVDHTSASAAAAAQRNRMARRDTLRRLMTDEP